MSVDKEDFVINLTDACQTHEQWLATVRYGLGTLLEDQPLLIEVIVREAMRAAEKAPPFAPADYVSSILKELGLRLVST